MSSAPAVRGRVLIAAVVGWIGLVLMLTLAPAHARPAGREAPSLFCVACGSRGLADLLLNVALFASLGWGVARGWGWRMALVVGVGLSLGVELAQLWIVDRFANPGDVLANGAGAGLGAWICGREARVLPGLGLAPAPPEGVYLRPVDGAVREHGFLRGPRARGLRGRDRHSVAALGAFGRPPCGPGEGRSGGRGRWRTCYRVTRSRSASPGAREHRV